MSLQKSLLPALVAAMVTVSACSGGGGSPSGDAGDKAGAYTLTYARTQRSGDCPNEEDPTWVQGILIIGDDESFDFGAGYVVDGAIAGDAYAFEGPITDVNGLLSVSGSGAFVTSGSTLSIMGDAVEGIIADYNTDLEEGADCRVRGTYSGAKTTGTGG